MIKINIQYLLTRREIIFKRIKLEPKSDHHVVPSVIKRDAKFGIQIGPDWPQMEQICDFLRLVSVQMY